VRRLIASQPKRSFAIGWVCLNKVAPVHEHREVTACRGHGDSYPSILNLGVERRLVISFFFSGVGLSPIGTAATSGLLYKPDDR
jgi:hypothetical protein